MGAGEHSVGPFSSSEIELEILPLLSPGNPYFWGRKSPWGNEAIKGYPLHIQSPPRCLIPLADGQGGLTRNLPFQPLVSTGWTLLCPSRPELMEVLKLPPGRIRAPWCPAVRLALPLVPRRTDGELGQGRAEGRKQWENLPDGSSGRAGPLSQLTLSPQHPAQHRAERERTGNARGPRLLT